MYTIYEYKDLYQRNKNVKKGKMLFLHQSEDLEEVKKVIKGWMEKRKWKEEESNKDKETVPRTIDEVMELWIGEFEEKIKEYDKNADGPVRFVVDRMTEHPLKKDMKILYTLCVQYYEFSEDLEKLMIRKMIKEMEDRESYFIS